MIKGKLKAINKREELVEESDKEQEQYDSMIENGTSDETSEEESSEDNAVSADDTGSEEEVNPTGEEDQSDSGHSENKLLTSRKRKLSLVNTTADPKTPKMSAENRKLYKAPTVEEINQLRETENLFHSNLFRMQIQEMLEEVKIKPKYKLFVDSWLLEFNQFLKVLKPMLEKEENTNIAWLRKSKVQVPIDMMGLHSKNFQFQFLQPETEAFLIGSGETDTWLAPALQADVCVRMPAKCFQKDDYLNLIYDQKRALYLAYIANQMVKKKFHSSDLKFSYVGNNPFKAVLEVVPDGKIGKKLSFRIFISPETEAFKLSRFVPWNSNLRGGLFGLQVNDEEAPLATPNYNATVLLDLTMKQNQLAVKETVGQHKSLKDGLILLKIWLRQRNLQIGFCRFSSHIMTLFVVYLFKQRKIHASMSSYQVARNVWQHLATSEWNVADKGVTLCPSSEHPSQPTMEQFHANYDVVFVDVTGYLNLCANLSLDVYHKVKYESQRSVELLNKTTANSFQALFMTSIPVYSHFDHFFKISNQSVIEKALKEFGPKADLFSFAGMWCPRIIKLISGILRKGLASRVLSLVPIEDPLAAWPVQDTPTSPIKFVRFGLVLNPDAACEILDKGPQANEPSSAEFRSFWGDKSQLRRFQDGSITEACVWSPASATPAQKRLIVKEIVTYLLNYHFKIARKSIDYIASDFDDAYKVDPLFYVFEDGSTDAESTSLNVIKKFDELAKQLRACDLPLDITGVQGISSMFRYCDPIPLLEQAKSYEENDKLLFQSYKVCEGVLQLGASGKWPSDLSAFRRIKTAFHIQIARSLRDKFKMIARGGIDGIWVLKDGYVFHVEIVHQKEIGLVKKAVTAKGLVQYVDTPASLEMEKQFNILPRMTSALHGLYQRYSSFGPTVMIAKRWLYSQLLDSFLWPDECTELLIAAQFLKEGPNPNPLQPQCGFFRFLQLMATCDFRNELILLNFNDEMTHEEITELDTKFSSDRDSYPPLAIITSYDTKKDCIWSKKSPSPQILARVILLARQALTLIEPAFTTNQSLPVRELFLASLDGYDLIITLKSNLVHSCHAWNFEPPRKSGPRIDATVPAAGFDPVECGLRELRDAYSEFALFFYNPCGGKHIAVIWKPDCFVEREFKVGQVNGSRVNETGLIQVNLEQLIEDFKIILTGLYYNFTDLRTKRLNGNS